MPRSTNVGTFSCLALELVNVVRSFGISGQTRRSFLFHPLAPERPPISREQQKKRLDELKNIFHEKKRQCWIRLEPFDVARSGSISSPVNSPFRHGQTSNQIPTV